MRSMRLWLPALAAGIAISLLGAASGGAQPKPPADFTFPQGKESPGPVTFSHARHADTGLKCTECHTKIFKMKKGSSGTLTMAKMNAGEWCGACHDGKKSVKDKVPFATTDKQACQNCHKK